MAVDTDTKRGHLGHVVVIGGNGFLGSHIVNLALTMWTCDAVSSVDLRCARNRHDGASYHECDITDEARIAALLDDIRPDVVINTASPTVSSAVYQAHELFYKVNVDGTRAVVNACQKAGVKAFIYTSSASVLSDGRSDIPNADETWPTISGAAQNDYYTNTKVQAEEIAIQANRTGPSNLLTLSIRPSGIFGEYDVQTLAAMVHAGRMGRTTVQVGDNNNVFDFTYVGNVAHAHLLAAHALLATAARGPNAPPPLDHERVDGEAFLITNDSPCYFWDFARTVWHAVGACKRGTADVWVLPKGLGYTAGFLSEMLFNYVLRREPTFTRQRLVLTTMTRYYNISKAKRLLHYQPLWTLSEGLARGVASFVDPDDTHNLPAYLRTSKGRSP